MHDPSLAGGWRRDGSGRGGPSNDGPPSEQRPPDGLVGGRYRLLERLGRGGMAVVWQGRDEVLHRDVAVKEVLPPRDLSPGLQEEIRERAMREARAAARLAHPSVVTVYDVVEDGGRPWIVMELLPPHTLSDVLASSGPLAPEAAARLGEQLIDALRTAHAAGVLHRDVKPSNVMIADDGRAVLTDFGIATVEEDPSITATGMLIGSPGYMAPERARGERPTAASDLWSLGATLFTATEGTGPFQRDGQLATLNAVISLEAPPAAHAGPLRPLIARMLDRDPARRPGAEETHEELRRIAAGLPGTMTVVAADGPDGADGGRIPPSGQATTQVLGTPSASTRRLPLDPAIPPGSPGDPGAAPPRPPQAPYRQPSHGESYGPRTTSFPPAAAGSTGRRGGGGPVVLFAVLVVVAGVLAFLLLRPELGGNVSPTTTTPPPRTTSEPSSPPVTTSEPVTSRAPLTVPPSPTETSTSATDTSEQPSEQPSEPSTEPSTSEASSPDTPSTAPGDGTDGTVTDGTGNGEGDGSPTSSG